MTHIGRSAISVVASVAAAGAITYAAWHFHQGFENQIVSQTQARMLATARSAAKGVEESIGKCSRALHALASVPSVRKDVYKRNSPCAQEGDYCAIDAFYDVHRDHTDGLYLLDSNGTILARMPFKEGKVGSSLAARPDVSYVLTEQKAHISEPFSTYANEPSVSMLEPVFYRNKFAGIVRYLIHTETIHDIFLEPIEAGGKDRTWLIDDDGIVLCHPEPKYIGGRATKLGTDQPLDRDRQELPIIIGKMLDGKEGTGTYCLIEQNEGRPETVKRLAAYAPVHVGNELWSIAVSMDYADITGPINRHQRATFGLAGLLILLFGTGGIFLFRIRRREDRLKTEAAHLKKIVDGAKTLRQKTHELTKSEQELAEILETSPDAITVLDSTGRIVRCNGALVRMFGYSSQEEMIGKDVLELLAEKDRARARGGFKRTLTAPIRSMEYTCVTRDGKEFTTETSASAIEGYPGGLTYVVAVSKDISERKDLQKALLEKEEAVLQETGLVLHESLAQTLVCAKMKSELAYGALEKESPGAEHIREVTEAVKQAITDMRNMSNTLFPLQLRHLGLVGALDQLAIEAGDRYEIDCHFEHDDKAVSVADNTALQFYRIAQQAVDNASQHANPDGRDDFKIRVRLASDNGSTTLTVRDNGVGFQGTPEAGIGTKHMSYRADTIGASFDVKSKKGKGTTVTVSCKKPGTPY